MRWVKPAGRNLVSDRFASHTCGTSVKSRSKSFPLARALRLGPAGACKRPTPLVELTRLNPIRRMANAFAHLTEVPLEKEVEKGADDRNGSYAANVFPARGNRGFDDVGSELEGQSFNEPATEAKPDKPIQYSDAGEQARSKQPP